MYKLLTSLVSSVVLFCLVAVDAIADAGPRYKPSSRSPAALDILSNEYGYSRTAPEALAIGDQAPDFSLPGPFGTHAVLSELLKSGPAVLIFYRGHW